MPASTCIVTRAGAAALAANDSGLASDFSVQPSAGGGGEEAEGDDDGEADGGADGEDEAEPGGEDERGWEAEVDGGSVAAPRTRRPRRPARLRKR